MPAEDNQSILPEARHRCGSILPIGPKLQGGRSDLGGDLEKVQQDHSSSSGSVLLAKELGAPAEE